MSEVKELPFISMTKWDSMSFTELLEQKNMLFTRWEFLQSKGYSYAKEVLVGLQQIDEKIKEKALGPQTSSYS